MSRAVRKKQAKKQSKAKQAPAHVYDLGEPSYFGLDGVVCDPPKEFETHHTISIQHKPTGCMFNIRAFVMMMKLNAMREGSVYSIKSLTAVTPCVVELQGKTRRSLASRDKINGDFTFPFGLTARKLVRFTLEIEVFHKLSFPPRVFGDRGVSLMVWAMKRGVIVPSASEEEKSSKTAMSFSFVPAANVTRFRFPPGVMLELADESVPTLPRYRSPYASDHELPSPKAAVVVKQLLGFHVLAPNARRVSIRAFTKDVDNLSWNKLKESLVVEEL
jgi:hypothetical protein